MTRPRTTDLRRIAWLVPTFILTAASRGSAQPPAPPAPPVITIDEEFVIEGRVQKPEAFYFLRRTPFGYVIRALDQDFLQEIVRAVGADPF